MKEIKQVNDYMKRACVVDSKYKPSIFSLHMVYNWFIGQFEKAQIEYLTLYV
jgi:hypothetical protein